MSPSIRIDRDVYRALQEGAEPFVDTPNSVLRRVLGLESLAAQEPESADRKAVRGKNSPTTKKGMGTNKDVGTTKLDSEVQKPGSSQPNRRAPSDAILPEGEYIMPLLTALAERGGSAPAREIVAEVGRRLRGKLMPLDMEPLASGGVRWRNRVQFVRLRLVEEGLMQRRSTRGVWALTDSGLARAQGEAA